MFFEGKLEASKGSTLQQFLFAKQKTKKISTATT
jgi:hypothetical protein